MKDQMGKACSKKGRGDKRSSYKVLVGYPDGRNHFEYLGVNGRIIL
jgi:hypothetical protein